MRVWLDDRRTPPEPDWVWVRTPSEVIELLRSGEVEELSLDHDLSLIEGDREETGYDVLLWLEQQFGNGIAEFPLPKLKAHTSNPVAMRRMNLAIMSIERLASASRS